MTPTLKPGQIVVALNRPSRSYKIGDIVILHRNNRDIIKRISRVRNYEVYVEGDNPGQSTDSRQFGWVGVQLIAGKVLWPTRLHKASQR
jgi:phage repressor protein C with HTH and peptisase S24 domain